MNSIETHRPLRWRLRVKVNELRGRTDGRSWWCGSHWNGHTCDVCGMKVIGSGHIRGEYARVHARWAPTTDRPLEESLRVFCGEGWLPESAMLAHKGDEVVGVGSLYGAPFVFAEHGLFMIADTVRTDKQALRSLVAAQLGWARARGVRISFEADEANTELWQLTHELPARVGPELLLLSTERG